MNTITPAQIEQEKWGLIFYKFGDDYLLKIEYYVDKSVCVFNEHWLEKNGDLVKI